MAPRKPQIILRTAFDVSKYQNAQNSPVSSNAARVEHYLIGSQTFQENFPEFRKFEVIIIDNTVKSTEKIPRDFLAMWNGAQVICTNTNRFGRYNKGAGDVETLRYALKRNLIKSNFLFHELRLKSISPDFIENFLNSPRNLITRETDLNSVRSGYAGFEYSTARVFYTSTSLLAMTVKKQSIEDLLFRFWTEHSLEFFPTGNYAARFDPAANEYIPY